MVATKERIKTYYVSISADTFLSPLEWMTSEGGWVVKSRSDFGYQGEQDTIADIFSIFGDMPEPGILLVNLGAGRVYAPNLQNYDGVPAIAWGDNKLPLVKGKDGLKLGTASVTVQEAIQKRKDDDGKEYDFPIVKLVCENVIGAERLRMELLARLAEGADPSEVADLLKEGAFDEVIGLLATPGKGGGLCIEVAMLARSFNLSGVANLPMLNLPVTGYEMKSFDWKNGDKVQTIRSVAVHIDPAALPPVSLIKRKDPQTGVKRIYSITREQFKGLQFGDSSNAYRFFFGNKPEELSALIAAGSLTLKILGYASTDKNHTPIHALVKSPLPVNADYSMLDLDALEEYPPLPGKDDQAKEPPALPPATSEAVDTIAVPSEVIEDIEV
jgi:hypothetical protein